MFHLREPVGHALRRAHREAAGFHGAGEPLEERLVIVHDQDGPILDGLGKLQLGHRNNPLAFTLPGGLVGLVVLDPFCDLRRHRALF